MPSTEQPGTVSDTTSTAVAGSDTSREVKPFSREQFVSEMVLNHLHHMNQMEIQLSQLAQEKASSDQIKSMARQISADHEVMEKRVLEIAKARGLWLESYQPATYERANLDRLRSYSGRDFDQAYSLILRTGHKDALEDLRGFRRDVKDPQINSLISQAMPKIQQHASMSHSGAQMGGEVGEDLGSYE
jgi:putative membrane protein